MSQKLEELLDLLEEHKYDQVFIFNTYNTCKEAENAWHPDWSACPICQAELTEDGYLYHKKPEDFHQ